MSRNWSEIEEKLVQACERAKADGVKIVSGTFGFYRKGKECCPVTAFLGPDQPIGDNVTAGAEKLGLPRQQTWDLVFGFDAQEDYSRKNSEGYKTGLRIRARVLP